MPSFNLLSRTSKGVSWGKLLPIFTPLSFKSGAFLMLISLSSLSLMPSYALQRTLIVLCPLSFQLTMMNCLNLSKSLWSIHLAAVKTLMHLAWSMAHVPRAFPNLLEQRPLLLKTLMLAPGVATLARLFRFRERRSTINGWSVIPHILSGSIGAILMWSQLLQSRLSSTSTNMCTRAMIALLWSLADAGMRSSSIWMHDISAAVRLCG